MRLGFTPLAFACAGLVACASFAIAARVSAQGMSVMWTGPAHVTALHAENTGRVRVQTDINPFDCTSVGGVVESQFHMHTYTFPTEGMTTNEGLDRMHSLLVTALTTGRQVAFLVGPATEAPGTCAIARLILY